MVVQPLVFFSKYPRLIKFLFSNVDQTVVASKFVKSAFDMLNIKVTIIPHIMELNKWPSRLRKGKINNLLWVRHLRPEYNPAMVIDVMGIIQKQYNNLNLKIVGAGPMIDELKNLIKQKKLHNVDLLGRISEKDLQQSFDSADIFINTSTVDNQPVSVLEAMSCGIPVISTNVGGIPEIITHEYNGLLSDDKDVKAMARNIEKLLRDSKLYTHMSINCKQFIDKNFTGEEIYKKWENIYSKIGYKI